MSRLLSFHRAIVTELLEEDGLCVVGSGLGSRRIISCLLRIHASPENLVCLLNSDADEQDALNMDLAAMGVKGRGLQAINNETPASER